LIIEDPDTQESWVPHGKLAWYVGPAPEHYRCYQLFIPETGGTRILGTVEFFPHYSTVPKLSSADAATHAAHNLILALERPYPKTPFPMLSTRHITALKQLANLFRTVTAPDNVPRVAKAVDPTAKIAPQIARVATPVPGKVPPIPRVATPVPRVTATTPHNPAQRFQPRPPTHRYPTRNRSIFAASAVHELLRRKNQRTLQQYANSVLHPTTGKAMSYEQLMKDPLTKAIWIQATTTELARLAQGMDDITEGTNTVFNLSHDEIENIPKDRTVTHARIVVNYWPQKQDPNCVRITVGGNLIKYPGEVTTQTADMTTSKLLWNSVFSTPNAKYCCTDVKNFYLETPMERYEYMCLPVHLIPDEFLQAYHLQDKIYYKGYLYLEIRKGMYGLSQAGILANQLLRKRLAPHGYTEAKHTPGLWTHHTRPITFTLVVDDFGIKYTISSTPLKSTTPSQPIGPSVSTAGSNSIGCMTTPSGISTSQCPSMWHRNARSLITLIPRNRNTRRIRRRPCDMAAVHRTLPQQTRPHRCHRKNTSESRK
jgi:hypothetical protein